MSSRIAALLLCLPVLAASPATARDRDPRFDMIAATVEVIAGAEFCGSPSRSAYADVEAYIGREIGQDSIRRIWAEAIEQRMLNLAAFPAYDCDGVVAKFTAFDFSPFRSAEVVAAVAAPASTDISAPSGPAAERPAMTPAEFDEVSIYADGEPWREVGEIPPAFRGFFSAVCFMGAMQYTATGVTSHWKGEKPRPGTVGSIHVSGGRLLLAAKGNRTVLEMTAGGDQFRVAQIYPREIPLENAPQATLPRCSEADLRAFVNPADLREARVAPAGKSAALEMCETYEPLMEVVLDMHANGSRMEDAFRMNGAPVSPGDRLWYWIDRSIRDVYEGAYARIGQDVVSGKWADSCRSWLEFRG